MESSCEGTPLFSLSLSLSPFAVMDDPTRRPSFVHPYLSSFLLTGGRDPSKPSFLTLVPLLPPSFSLPNLIVLQQCEVSVWEWCTFRGEEGQGGDSLQCRDTVRIS